MSARDHIPGARTRRLGAAVAAVLSVACAVATTLLAPGDPARTVAGLLLVLVLPGAALASAALPTRRDVGFELVALVPGLSISVAVLATVALDAAGVQLGSTAWAVTLAGVTVAACAVAALRRGPTSTTPPRVTSGELVTPSRLGGVAWGVLVVALVAVTAIVTVGSVRHVQRGSRFTELWALPAAGRADAVVIGVRNHENARRRYALEVRTGQTVVASWSGVDVGEGRTWTRAVTVPHGGEPLRVVLHQGTLSSAPYRHVQLTLGTPDTAAAPAPGPTRLLVRMAAGPPPATLVTVRSGLDGVGRFGLVIQIGAHPLVTYEHIQLAPHGSVTIVVPLPAGVRGRVRVGLHRGDIAGPLERHLIGPPRAALPPPGVPTGGSR